MVERRLRRPARDCSSRWPRPCARTRGASARRPSATRWAGRSTRSASRTSAPPRSSSSCSATSAGRAAASWRCAGTPRIQGSTDIPTLYNILPGYLPMPSSHRETTLDRYVEQNAPRTRLLGPTRGPTSSACSRRGGATRRRPRTTSASTTCRASRATTRTTRRWRHARRQGRGLLRHGREPGRRLGERQDAPPGAGQARLAGRARLRRDRDRRVLARRRPEIETGELRTDGHRDRGVPHAGRGPHREGRHASPTRSACCSGTTRRSSRRATAARSCGSYYHLALRITREAGGLDRAERPADPRPDVGLPDRGPARRAERRARCSPRSAASTPRATQLVRLPPRWPTTARPRAAAGSTAAATPTASTRPRGASRAGAELGRPRVGLGVAGEPAHPLQPRLGRSRRAGRGRSASATSGGTRSEGEWTGHDVPDFTPDKRPDYEPARGRHGPDALRGDEPFIMQADGRGLALRAHGLIDGPLPDALRAARVAVRQPAVRAAAPTRRASVSIGPRTRTTRAATGADVSRTSSPPTG